MNRAQRSSNEMLIKRSAHTRGFLMNRAQRSSNEMLIKRSAHTAFY
jgi:hypothetical protein